VRQWNKGQSGRLTWHIYGVIPIQDGQTTSAVRPALLTGRN